MISWHLKLKDSRVHISPWQCVRCELSWKPRSHTQVCFPPGWSTQRPRPHTPGLLSHAPCTAAHRNMAVKVRHLPSVCSWPQVSALTRQIVHINTKTVLSNGFCFDLSELTEQMKNVLPTRRPLCPVLTLNSGGRRAHSRSGFQREVFAGSRPTLGALRLGRSGEGVPSGWRRIGPIHWRETIGCWEQKQQRQVSLSSAAPSSLTQSSSSNQSAAGKGFHKRCQRLPA